MANLENFSENENVDIHHNEDEDETSPMSRNLQSRFEAQSTSKSKKVNGCDINNNLNKLPVAVKFIANSIIQSTTTMIEASLAMMETTKDIIRERFVNPNSLQNYDVWVMFTDLGISHPFLTAAYIFLIRDRKMLEGLIRCLNEYRKIL